MKIIVRHPGKVQCGDRVFQCAIGRGGIGNKVGEGDGITPIGLYPLRSVFFRADRMSPPSTGLPVAPLLSTDGWCDDPGHIDYNRQILVPATANHEKLWREDPVEPGKGSAVFMHVARPLFEPTEGCVALETNDLLKVLETCDADSQIEIMTPP